jgi:hypothetical protein
MPRKKVDQVEGMISWFGTAPLAAVDVVFGIVKGIVRDRQPKVVAKPIVRRRRKAMPPAPTLEKLAAEILPPPVPKQVAHPRRRRMRADSQPPVNEATPLVPAVEEVGDDPDAAYEGQ